MQDRYSDGRRTFRLWIKTSLEMMSSFLTSSPLALEPP